MQNITLSSLSVILNHRSITLLNPHVNTLKINKFFGSKSFSPLLVIHHSCKRPVKVFELTNSKFDRFLLPVIHGSISSNKVLLETEDLHYSIKNNIFTNQHSNYQGSAIGWSSNILFVSLESCSFINCTSEASSSSFQRGDGVSGGACFLSCNKIDMKKCFFDSCSAPSLGSALYVSAPQGSLSNFSCLCDINCGRTKYTTYQSVCTFETTTSFIRDLNSTNAISANFCGVLFIGTVPLSFTLNYISLIINDEPGSSCPLGLTLKDSTCSGTISNTYISKAVFDGIISLWYGNYYFDNIIFNECSGNLYKIFIYPVNVVSFSNSYFSIGIKLLDSKTDKYCSIGVTSTKLHMQCKYVIKRILCQSHRRIRQQLKMNIMLTMIFVYSK